MALHLTEWLLDLGSCRQDLKRVDFDGVEEALQELREKAAQAMSDYAEPGTTANEEERALLLEMAERLQCISDDLDLFLETVEFHHVADAYGRAVELNRLRDQLRSQLETEHPELAGDSLG